MGACCTIDAEQPSLSTSVDYLIKKNNKTFKALFLCFIELGEYGAALKILKIKNKTYEFYSKNQEVRHYLDTCESKSIYFKCLLKKELKQVQDINQILQQTAKKLLKDLKVSFFTDIHKYIQGLQDKYQDCSKLKQLYTYFEKNRAGLEGFDDCVYIVNNRKKILDKYDDLIKEVCKRSTYVFNNKAKRVVYKKNKVLSHRRNWEMFNKEIILEFDKGLEELSESFNCK